MEYFYLFLWSLPLSIWYSSRFEWLLHFYFMHRKTWGITFGYERHHLIHHVVFGTNEKYVSSEKEEMNLIPMGKLHGPMLVFIASAPWWALTGFLCLWLPFLWPIPLCMTVTLILNFIVYETFHYVMHMEEDLWLKHWCVYKWLDAHHHLHHAHMGKNLNVVFPIGDLLSGTLLLPSKRDEKGFKPVRLPRFLMVDVVKMLRYYVFRYNVA
jgi:hypothetical protein